MTATPSSEARAEAERRYPLGRFGVKKAVEQSCRQQGFVEGAEWKGAQNELRDAVEAAAQDARTAYFVPAHKGHDHESQGANWIALNQAMIRLDDALRALGVESSDEGEADG
jgi:hypothetical protein